VRQTKLASSQVNLVGPLLILYRKIEHQHRRIQDFTTEEAREDASGNFPKGDRAIGSGCEVLLVESGRP